MMFPEYIIWSSITTLTSDKRQQLIEFVSLAHLLYQNTCAFISSNLVYQICTIPFGVHTSVFGDKLIFEDHHLRPILERVGFRESIYDYEIIWEKSDKYEADIVTAGLFLLAKSLKVYIKLNVFYSRYALLTCTCT